MYGRLADKVITVLRDPNQELDLNRVCGNFDMSVANKAFSILKKNQFWKCLVKMIKLYVHTKL